MAWAEWRSGRPAGWQRRLASWAAALAAGGLINLAQPYGLRGFLFPLTLLTEILHPGTAHKNVIGEFAPLYSSPHLLAMALPFLVFTAVSLLSALLAGRKVRPFLTLLSLVMAYLAVSAIRNLSVSGVVMAGLLAAHLPMLLERRAGWPGWERAARIVGLAAATAALLISLLSVALPVRRWDLTFMRPGLGVDWEKYPVGSARFLKTIGYRGGIINSEWMGGYLTWTGWPEWKVMADTRMEVGGQAAILDYFKALSDMTELDEVARKFDANAVVMSFQAPYTGAFRKILADQRWALVGLDRSGGVFLRRGSRWDGEIGRHEIKDPLKYEIKIP